MKICSALYYIISSAGLFDMTYSGWNQR